MIGAETSVEVYCISEQAEVVVRGFLTATPGVVVTTGLGESPWVVTHSRSGASIAGADDPEQAMGFAAALDGMCDWTASGAEIRSIAGIDQQVAELRRLHGVSQASDPVAPAETLAR